MTPEAQRIAIAEACGWADCGDVGLSVPYGFESRNKVNKHALPDYLSDLNAMHEAEKVLNTDQASDYYWKLKELQPIPGTVPCGHWVYHCTAAQRAEAFLRTIGKWTK